MFSKIFVVLAAVATVAIAQPTAGGAPDVNASQCGNGQKEACCSSPTDGNSLIAGLNCLSVPVLAIPVQQACGSNVAACCPSDEATGALVLQANCNAIPL